MKRVMIPMLVTFALMSGMTGCGDKATPSGNATPPAGGLKAGGAGGGGGKGALDVPPPPPPPPMPGR